MMIVSGPVIGREVEDCEDVKSMPGSREKNDPMSCFVRYKLCESASVQITWWMSMSRERPQAPTFLLLKEW